MNIHNQCSFTVFFKSQKEIINHVGSFFFDKKRLKKVRIESIVSKINEWLEPKSRSLPEFFIGSKNDDEICIFFSNLPDGWSSAARMLSKISSSKSIQIRMSNEILEYQLISGGDTIRIVQLIKEEKWKFFQQGQLLSYEDASIYQSKNINERFNANLIIDYLAHENINFSTIMNEKFKGIRLQVLDWDYL